MATSFFIIAVLVRPATASANATIWQDSPIGIGYTGTQNNVIGTASTT